MCALGGRALDRYRYKSFNPFQIVDPLQVYDNINLGRRIDPSWPDDGWRARGGRSNWRDWLPQEGMEGVVSKAMQFSKIMEMYTMS